MFTYRFEGHEAEEFPGLAGELVHNQGRESALLEPGDRIELPEPVLHARLVPADHETELATAHLAEGVELVEEAVNESAATGEPVEVPYEDMTRETLRTLAATREPAVDVTGLRSRDELAAALRADDEARVAAIEAARSGEEV